MTEVLYYLSNFINTPNIFTNSTKARSKRFDTWFHRQVKSIQVPCASGCDGRELFREKVFLSRLTKLVPAWPTFSLFRSLHTFAHRSLFSSLERARDKLPLGNRRKTRCEREDGRRIMCNNEHDMWGWSLKSKYWDADNMMKQKKTYSLQTLNVFLRYWHFYCRSSFFRVSPGLRPICPIL